jgi:hypothetical protein
LENECQGIVPVPVSRLDIMARLFDGFPFSRERQLRRYFVENSNCSLRPIEIFNLLSSLLGKEGECAKYFWL